MLTLKLSFSWKMTFNLHISGPYVGHPFFFICSSDSLWKTTKQVAKFNTCWMRVDPYQILRNCDKVDARIRQAPTIGVVFKLHHYSCIGLYRSNYGLLVDTMWPCSPRPIFYLSLSLQTNPVSQWCKIVLANIQIFYYFSFFNWTAFLFLNIYIYIFLA